MKEEGCKSRCPTMKTLKCCLQREHSGCHQSINGVIKWYKGRVTIHGAEVSNKGLRFRTEKLMNEIQKRT